MKPLSGQSVLLTGASRGIGAVIARALAAEGMRLVLSARSAGPLEAVAAELRAGGTEVQCCPADLSHPDGVQELAAAATRVSGGVDVLVNNAGLYEVVEFVSQPPEAIEATLFLNLTAPLLLARHLLPPMLERGQGHIVNIASIAGLVAAPYQETYAASKHGLVGFTRSLASTLQAEGHTVRVSSVCPSVVEGGGSFADDTRATGLKAPRLLGAVSPEQVARTVVSVLHTGSSQAVVCDGPPLLPFTLLQNVAPRLTNWVVERTGSTALFQKMADNVKRSS